MLITWFTIMYLLLADLVLLIHFLFVVFVVLGGLLVLKWPRLLMWHLTAFVWGVFMEFSGLICPLTPLEIWLRHQAEVGVYEGGFINHYLMPIVYPPGLTYTSQIVIGLLLVGFNAIVYGIFIYWRRKKQHSNL